MPRSRPRTGGAFRNVLATVCALVFSASVGGSAFAQSAPTEQLDVSASDGVWTVLTMAPDGSWGAATESMSNRGIENAVAECRFKYGREIGCGGYIVEFQQGWVLGIRCGNETILAAERELADAERSARRREHELRTIYRRNLPPCRRVVTISPHGAVIVPGGRPSTPK